MALDQPGDVAGIAERQHGLVQTLNGVEGLHPQQTLLQHADEMLGAAVGLGRPDESG